MLSAIAVGKVVAGLVGLALVSSIKVNKGDADTIVVDNRTNPEVLNAILKTR